VERKLKLKSNVEVVSSRVDQETELLQVSGLGEGEGREWVEMPGLRGSRFGL